MRVHGSRSNWQSINQKMQKKSEIWTNKKEILKIAWFLNGSSSFSINERTKYKKFENSDTFYTHCICTCWPLYLYLLTLVFLPADPCICTCWRLYLYLLTLHLYLLTPSICTCWPLVFVPADPNGKCCKERKECLTIRHQWIFKKNFNDTM